MLSSMIRLLPLLVLPACQDPGETGPSEERLPLAELKGGDYQFYTEGVEDGCLDGALEALFMPEGPATPHPFEYPVYVPSLEELPMSYAVDFREPFVGMDVTVSQLDETTLQVDGDTMPDVELGVASGDCAADMEADALLWAVGEGALRGTADIAVRDPEGSEGLCPVFDQDPCTVELVLSAVIDG